MIYIYIYIHIFGIGDVDWGRRFTLVNQKIWRMSAETSIPVPVASQFLLKPTLPVESDRQTDRQTDMFHDMFVYQATISPD